MASAAVAPPDQSAEAAHGVNPWLIAASVMLATFMEVLDTAIASVALPYIAGSLSASTDEATWVLTSYLVANAIVLPASNWFSLKFGRKRFLMSCVAIFTAASFACGAAPTLAFILLARVIQGAGGGALQPLSQAILLESFPPAKRGAAMAVFAFGVVVAPVLGPTLGGWLTDTYSWRYAFYINIPIGILALFMINRFIHDPAYISKAKVAPLDRYGFAALVIWTGCLQVVLDKGQEDDWFGAIWIRWAVFFLVVSFIYFCWRCWTQKDTIVDLKVLKDRNFLIGCILIFMFGIGIYSTVTVLPLFYQELLGYTAFTAGLVVAPRGIGAICGMPIIGYLSNKIDPRWLLTFGFFTFGLTTLYFGNVTLDLSPTTLLLPILITGFGLSFVFVPISTAAYGTLEATNKSATPAASSISCATSAAPSASPSPKPSSPAAAPSTRTRSSTPSPSPASNFRIRCIPRLSSSPAGSVTPTLFPPPRRRSTSSLAVRPPTGPSSTSSAGSPSSASSASESSGSSKK